MLVKPARSAALLYAGSPQAGWVRVVPALERSRSATAAAQRRTWPPQFAALPLTRPWPRRRK